MRRYWREQQPPRMLRGAEMTRLMGGIVMLAVLYMLIVRTGEADMWRWLAPETVAVSQEQPKTKTLPPATGPTDETPEQAEEARNEFQALSDGGVTLGPEEMEAYDRLVLWVESQSFARLRQRARSDLLFTNFHDEPDKYRGQLVTLDLNVRRILDGGKNRDGTQLYEVWGFTRESLDRLYVAVVVDLPKGMPIGPSVYENVRFAGYFLKLQGYHSAGVKPGTVPDRAPLLIGRLQWEHAAAAPAENSREWIWAAALLAAIALVFSLRWVYYKLKPRPPAARPLVPDAADGEVIPIDVWLERANFDAEDRSRHQ
jgi:hypothetical protein